jgi:hypothetical protein
MSKQKPTAWFYDLCAHEDASRLIGGKKGGNAKRAKAADKR